METSYFPSITGKNTCPVAPTYCYSFGFMARNF